MVTRSQYYKELSHRDIGRSEVLNFLAKLVTSAS